jgi:hypothetical protein
MSPTVVHPTEIITNDSRDRFFISSSGIPPKLAIP